MLNVAFLGDFLLDLSCKADRAKAIKWLHKVGNKPLEGVDSVPIFRDVNLSICDRLPKANWRVIIQSNGEVHLQYGAGVERQENAIFEGVWYGEYSKFDFDNSSYVYGSGVKIVDDEIIFVPPSHSLDCICMLFDKQDKSMVFSNSIISCLALVSLNEMADLSAKISDISHVENDRITSGGVFNYNPKLYEDERYIFYNLMYHNFSFKSGLSASILPRIKMEKFGTYEEYIDFLDDVIASLIRNGSSNFRERKLKPMSSISSGYDSPAVSVLCAKAGVEQFATINVTVGGQSDSGKSIAEKLGLSCTECQHPLGEDIKDLTTALDEEYIEMLHIFLATQGIGDNVALMAFDEVIGDSLFFSGTYGDVFWARNEWREAGFPLTKSYEKSIGEYRLDKGFAFIPVPAIGMQFPKSVFRLSDSCEMKPWMVGGTYDRPIPRRIIEDAGVPRGTFAIEKNATNPHPLNVLEYKQLSYFMRLKRYLS